MKNKNKIGIVVASYLPTSNHFISLQNRCIDSLNKQTRLPDVVTFVFNGFEETLNVMPRLQLIGIENLKRTIQSWCNFETRFYFIGEKIGCAAARNLGFEIMQKDIDYLGFLDVDDRYEPKKLELQEKYMLQNPETEIVTTMHTDFNIDMNGLLEETTNHSDVDSFEKIKEKIKKENCIVGASSLIKKDLFLELDGFDLSQIPGEIWWNHNKPMWEDWDFWIRAIEKGAVIKVLPERLYQWHHDLGVSRYFNVERYRKQQESDNEKRS